MMTLKKIGGLIAVAAILGGAAWMKMRSDPTNRVSRGTERVERETFFKDTEESEIQGLEVSWPDGEHQVFRRIVGADWLIETPHGWRRGHGDAVVHYLHTLGAYDEIRPNMEGVLKASNSAQHERFTIGSGDAPRVRFLKEDGTVVEDLHISPKQPDGMKRFAWIRRYGDDRVFMVESPLYDNFRKPSKGDWRSPVLFQFFGIETLEWIRFESPDPTLSWRLRFVQDIEANYPVFIEHDGGEESAKEQNAKRIIQNLNIWTANGFAEDRPDEEPDFSNPFGEISIKTTNLDLPITLTIGSEIPGTDGARWAKSTLDKPEWGTIYVVENAGRIVPSLSMLLQEDSPKLRELQAKMSEAPEAEPADQSTTE